MINIPDPLPRRSWLRGVARYLILGGLGLLVGKLVLRDGGACPRIVPDCPACALWSHCRLPRAGQVRNRARGVTS
jgi:hypothetical protein